jgi:hypothetical protein
MLWSAEPGPASRGVVLAECFCSHHHGLFPVANKKHSRNEPLVEYPFAAPASRVSDKSAEENEKQRERTDPDDPFLDARVRGR